MTRPVQVFDGDGIEHEPRKPVPFPNKTGTTRLRRLATWLRQMQYALLSEVLLQVIDDDHDAMGDKELKSLHAGVVDVFRRNRCQKRFTSERQYLKLLVEYRLSRLDSD